MPITPGRYPLTYAATVSAYGNSYSLPELTILKDRLAVVEGLLTTSAIIAATGVLATLPAGCIPTNYPGYKILDGGAPVGAQGVYIYAPNRQILTAPGLAANGIQVLDGLVFIVGLHHVTLVGASILSGYQASLPYVTGLLPQLRPLLGREGDPVTLMNRGVGVGGTTAQMAAPANLGNLVTDLPDYVVMQDGMVNDAIAGVPTVQTIANLQTIILAAEAVGAKPILATCPAFGNNASWTAAAEGLRQASNAWIRTQPYVIDLDQTPLHNMSNPNKPTLAAAFDSGDGVHPNDAGYKGYAEIFSSMLP